MVRCQQKTSPWTPSLGSDAMGTNHGAAATRIIIITTTTTATTRIIIIIRCKWDNHHYQSQHYSQSQHHSHDYTRGNGGGGRIGASFFTRVGRDLGAYHEWDACHHAAAAVSSIQENDDQHRITSSTSTSITTTSTVLCHHDATRPNSLATIGFVATCSPCRAGHHHSNHSNSNSNTSNHHSILLAPVVVVTKKEQTPVHPCRIRRTRTLVGRLASQMDADRSGRCPFGLVTSAPPAHIRMV